MKKIFSFFIPIVLLLFTTNSNAQCLGITGSNQAIVVAQSMVCTQTVYVSIVPGTCPSTFFYYSVPTWITATYTSIGSNGYLITLLFARNYSNTSRYHTMQLTVGSINIEQQGVVCETYVETPYIEFDQIGGNKTINIISNQYANCYGITCTNVPSWITISNNSDVNCLPNTTGVPRYAVISYSNNTNYEKSILVYQKSSTNSACETNFSKESIFFDTAGSSDTISVGFVGSNCNTEPFIFFNVPQWITMNSSPDGSQINVSSGSAYSQYQVSRYAEILCLIPSKNIIKRISVHQKSTCCSLCTGTVGNMYYSPSVENIGGFRTYPVTYQNNDCSNMLVFTNVPNWVTLQNNISFGPTASYFVQAAFLPNRSLIPSVVVPARAATINYHIPNSSVSGTFIVNQDECNNPWYNDTDGDGFGDIDSPIVAYSCVMPYAGVVSNNLDKCPNIYNLGNEGCEPGYTILNWISNDYFDVLGNTVSSSKTYFDDLGKPTESLSKDYVTNKVWGSEIVYDSFGRKKQESFPATNPNNLFRTKFLSNLNNKGLYLDKYYSNNNTVEPYQATATHPFSEINYDKLNPGNVVSIIGGNQIGGEWKTGFSYTVPAAQEMYYLFGYNFFDGTLSSIPIKEEVQTKFYKSVTIDANGVENVVFTDGENKMLASAKSGTTTPAAINPYQVHSLIGTQGFIDVCIPPGITTSQISLIGGATNYKVYNLRENTGLPTTALLIGGNCYRIEALVKPTDDPKLFVTNATPSVLSYSSTDPAGVKGVSYYVNYYDYTINIYDKTGRLTKNIQPNGFSDVYPSSTNNFSIVAEPAYMSSTYNKFFSSYKYNTLGQVLEVTNVDEGSSKFAYRNDGQIRYSQSALQAQLTAGVYKVSYTNYDSYGRPIESGIIASANAAIWSLLQANVDNPVLIPTTIVPATLSERIFSVYDDVTNVTTTATSQLPSPYSITIPTAQSLASLAPTYIPKNVSGSVAVTYKADATTINSITWYSYDIYGRSEWIVQYNDGFGNDAKTIDYEYDNNGNISKVLYQKNNTTEKFIHRYTYDVNGVVTRAETSKDNTTFINHADYTYYLTGELKRVNLIQAQQGLDYVYTLGGQLKSINHPSLEQAKDPGGDYNDFFGLTLDYYNGDYIRSNTNITNTTNISGANQDFTGNIKASIWSNKQLDVKNWYPASPSNPSTKKAYLYYYNRNNFLTDALYGAISPGSNFISTGPLLNEGGITYDANGNIKTLSRKDNATNQIDVLSYTYINGKNQLGHVDDAATIASPTTDIKDQNPGNYTYDAIGQMTKNTQENLFYFYNTQGLMTDVKKGLNSVVKFFYNERGQRIKKESYNTASPFSLLGTTYYLVDLSGNVMSNYYRSNTIPFTITQTELPIYGINRIGVYVKGTTVPAVPDYANYEITDHLGNVRAVMKKVFNGGVSVNSYADYYPFGEQLPGRNSFSNYRYAFQGQELDLETGMEAFQLRLWDGRIGRWLSPDPMGQYASPYLGMGNNPISMIDPDGGFAFPEKPGTSVGQVHTDADGSWAWNGSNWQGQGNTPDFLNTVVVYNVFKKIKDTDEIGNFFGNLSMYGGATFDFSEKFIDKKSLLGRFDPLNATSFNNIIPIQGNVYDKTLKNLGNSLGHLGLFADLLGYYEAGTMIYNRKYTEASISSISNTIGIILGNKAPEYGFAWDLGYGFLGPALTNTRIYNMSLVSNKYEIRKTGLENGWWTNNDEREYRFGN